MDLLTFDTLGLGQRLLAVLAEMNFTTPTEIQGKAIPVLTQTKRIDMHAQAQTGTGKTLAFGLPLIERVDATRRQVQALVVAPTRELAVQIAESLRPFARACGVFTEVVYGGVSFDDQARNLNRGVQIVIGTPGRLNDHIRRGTLDLSGVDTLVLDEADIMLDMGFREEVDDLLRACNKQRNIWLFSATVKEGITDLKREHMRDVVTVRAGQPQQTASSSTRLLYAVVPMRGRVEALCRFIECAEDFYGFIFCQTKILTSEIADQLARRGFRVGALHGDLSQGQRNAMVKKFKSRDITIMVATDVAARGIDVPHLSHVVNYSLPEDQESFIHRIGRTGRAGREGTAITFLGRSDLYQVRSLERRFSFKLEQVEVPTRETIIAQRLNTVVSDIAALAASEVESHTAITQALAEFDDATCRLILSKLLHEKHVKPLMASEFGDFTERPAEGGYGEYESREGGRGGRSGGRFGGRGARSGGRFGDREGRGGDRGEYRVRTRSTPEGIQEIALSVGLEDGLTKHDVLDAVVKTGIIDERRVNKVRLIKRRSFVEVPVDLAGPIVEALKGVNLAGRRVRPVFVDSLA
jgi:ATP-dependent RNA helicase DeaD